MAFNITSATITDDGIIVSLEWQFTSETNGLSVSGTHSLQMPPGTVAVASATKEIMIGWLTDQLEEGEEYYNAYLDRVKANLDFQETLREVTFNDDNSTLNLDDDPTTVNDSY